MAGKLFFTWTYWFGKTPWDTGITPPEVLGFLEKAPPGRALDLGCGTGTNVITIAEHGWLAEGIDFVPRPVRIARRKAKKAGLAERTKFHVGDVLSRELFRGEYDLILDIGCFHSFEGEKVDRYIENAVSYLAPGGTLLLYVHLNLPSETGHGARQDDLDKIGQRLKLIKRTEGEEFSRPSAWLKFKKI